MVRIGTATHGSTVDGELMVQAVVDPVAPHQAIRVGTTGHGSAMDGIMRQAVVDPKSPVQHLASRLVTAAHGTTMSG